MSTLCLIRKLKKAILGNDLSTIEKIISKNPEMVNPVSHDLDKDKFIPLPIAMQHGQEEIIKLFIDFGADVNEKF